MDFITLKDKTFQKYISSEEIDEAVKRVANQINEDYKSESPIIIVTLNGAIIFAADLLKNLTIPCKISCVKLTSYQGTECTNQMNCLLGLTMSVKGEKVIIIEDIVDTGNTYVYLTDLLKKEGAVDIKIATMTFKPESYKKDLPVNYVGIVIPPKFVVGRGLDYDELGRNLKDIYQLYE